MRIFSAIPRDNRYATAPWVLFQDDRLRHSVLGDDSQKNNIYNIFSKRFTKSLPAPLDHPNPPTQKWAVVRDVGPICRHFMHMRSAQSIGASHKFYHAQPNKTKKTKDCDGIRTIRSDQGHLEPTPTVILLTRFMLSYHPQRLLQPPPP